MAGLQELWQHREDHPDPARRGSCQRAAPVGGCAPIPGRRPCQVKKYFDLQPYG